MKINRNNAFKVWEAMFDDAEYAVDFHGNYMCKEAFGDRDYYEIIDGERIYLGWNIHHILPKACGGSNKIENLICTNIVTNDKAEDKTSFVIDDIHYQVRKIYGTSEHEIVILG